MKISIKNIGLINEANLEINDISILVGVNKSGKSSIGKGIYSVLNGISPNFEEEYNYSKSKMEQRILDFIERNVRESYFYTEEYEEIKNRLSEKVERKINKLEFFKRRKLLERIEFTKELFLEELTEKIEREISNNKLDYIEVVLKYLNEVNNLFELNRRRNLPDDKMIESIFQLFDKLDCYLNKNQASKILLDENEQQNQLELDKGNILRDGQKKIERRLLKIIGDVRKLLAEFLDLKKEKFSDLSSKEQIIKKILETEFDTPVKSGKNKLKIKIDSLEISYSDNQVIIENEGDIFYNDAVLIDSPHLVFSSLTGNRYSHIGYLKYLISKEEETNIFDGELDKNIKKLEEKIIEIIGGKVSYNKEERAFRYLDSDKNEFGENDLASGIKNLGVIMLILRKLTPRTVLILDEPEVHLHPEWIFKLAEIITLISRELKVKVLITTHNTFFLEAVELFNKKYNLEANYYYVCDGKLNEGLDDIYDAVNGNIIDNLNELRFSIEDGE